MRSFVTAVIAAIEAAAVALAGVIAVAVPVLLIWIVTFGLAAEPATVASWVSGIWLLGHLVPIGFTVPAESALAYGLPPEAVRVVLSLAPLGVTLLTAALGARAGWRFGRRGGAGAAGALGGAAGFGVMAFLATLVAGPLVAAPRPVAVLLPALVYAVPALAGFLVRAVRDEHEWWDRAIGGLQRALARFGIPGAAALRARAGLTARLSGILIMLLIGLSGIALALALVVGYARVTELSQSLQLDPLGSILVFLAQLAALPIALLWTMAWLTGGGFAIGVATSVTPFETLTGPLPALPMLGAIPQGWGSLGGLPPTLIAVVAIAAGAVFARRTELRRVSWAVAVVIPVLAGALAGLIVAGLSVLATGSIGPDRLAVTGASPWLVGGLAAAELGIGALIGVCAARFDVARVRAVIPDEMPGSSAVRSVRDRISERAGATLGLGPNPERSGRGDDPSADSLAAASTVDLSDAAVDTEGLVSGLASTGTSRTESTPEREFDRSAAGSETAAVPAEDDALLAAAYSSAAVSEADPARGVGREGAAASTRGPGADPDADADAASPTPGAGAGAGADAEADTDLIEPLDDGTAVVEALFAETGEIADDTGSSRGAAGRAGDGSAGAAAADGPRERADADAQERAAARVRAEAQERAETARDAEREAAGERERAAAAARAAERAAETAAEREAAAAAAESAALAAYSWDPSAVTSEDPEPAPGPERGSGRGRGFGWRGSRRDR